jgi:acetone carboxylase beta subunit
MGEPRLCYVDVGGTFTDAFIVDDDGEWMLGKAPSTPHDASQGFLAAIEVACKQKERALDKTLASLHVLGYGATMALNALLTRSGGRPGLLVTKGFEHMLTMGRGKQSWTDMDRPDRLHPMTHRQLAPIIPFELTRGITGRIDSLGQEFIPLNEREVRQATRELLAAGVDSLVIVFLWSFLNPAHERSAARIAHEEAAACGWPDLPVYASVDVSPVIRELPRANATAIEAYVGPLVRRAFSQLEDELHGRGFKGQLQIMQSAGGLAPARHVKIVESIQSGPVGGLVGGRFIGELYQFDNIITTDVGGTSFDVGLVTGGSVGVNREPTVARMLVGVPMVEVISIGAGGGTIARIDPLSGRLQVGPQSAGAVPGPVCYGRGGSEPTVTDADLVLGYINPDYFLGGRIALDRERALAALREKIADPLGISPLEAAEGIREIIDTRMREAIRGLVLARGFDLSEYHLLAFGGGGAAHCAGYTEGLPLRGVLAFSFSSAFSAFGAAAADYEHHYTRSLNMIVPPDVDAAGKKELGARITAIWQELKQEGVAQMVREGFREAELHFRFQAMIRYGRQLNDLIVTSPVEAIRSAEDFDALIAAFETLYEEIYSRAARYPQAGYDIFEVGMVAWAPKLRPTLKAYPLARAKPQEAARKGYRRCYFRQNACETPLFELARVLPGNEITGPAIIEDPTTTVVIPPDRRARMDQYRTLWLENSNA